jgi:hypothetical protein
MKGSVLMNGWEAAIARMRPCRHGQTSADCVRCEDEQRGAQAMRSRIAEALRSFVQYNDDLYGDEGSAMRLCLALAEQIEGGLFPPAADIGSPSPHRRTEHR